MDQSEGVNTIKRRRAASQSGFTIMIRDLMIDTVIGVPAHERVSAQPLLMELEIEIAESRAGVTDRLADTVDYGALVEDLRACISGTRFFLLERLAEFVADRILSRHQAVRVYVQVSKIAILKDVRLVGIAVERFRVSETQANT